MPAFAFIPARFQSSRFPGKPLARIAGKPMIRHVWERAVSCRELSGVAVATDDHRIAACVAEFGGTAVMTEPGHPSGTDRICEAAVKAGVGDDDIVVNIQGDQPLLEPAAVTRLIAPLIEEPDISMSTLMWRIPPGEGVENPNHVKVVTDARGFALYFSRHPIPFHRDRERDAVYFKHLGLYAFRMRFLAAFTRLSRGRLETAEKLEQLRALEHGCPIKVVETPYNSIEVDVPADIRLVERLLRR